MGGTLWYHSLHGRDARPRETPGREIVLRQRALVKRVEASGRDASVEKKTLDLFERTLQVFEDHFRAWGEEIGPAGSRRSGRIEGYDPGYCALVMPGADRTRKSHPVRNKR